LFFSKALSEIGLIIFTALDFGLGQDQERALSEDLETLLELLASEDNSREEDEGIEHDQEHLIRSNQCKRVLHLCASHLAVESEAQKHYKAVCRALVSEALELSNFMEKVKKHETDSDCKELQELGLQDWARLWRQILKDLRTGVKLKKVDYTKTPVEYELTPYEVLMEDIRARKFTLNKIMVDGELPPRIKKDAHDIILHFIRHRPPLKPASERQLQPKRKESTPVELLMDSIRNSNARASLRKTGGPPKRPLMLRLNSNSSTTESSRTRILDDENLEDDIKSGTRRKVTLDPGLLDDLLNFSDEEESETEDQLSRQGSLDSIMSGVPESPQKSPQKSFKKGHQRRHSLTVCETPKRTISESKPRKPPMFETQTSTISNVSVESSSSSGSVTPTSQHSTPKFRQRSPSPALDESSLAQMQERLHAEFLQSEHWATALQTLDLTLDEVIHIRTVLTKAELEGLPLDGSLKDDVEKGKVCFLCMKTRFGFFSRGCKCELCSRQVCAKCSTKMRIPLEHFTSTPVFSLSPAQVQPLSDSIRTRVSNMLSPAQERCFSIGSAPTSPNLQRKFATSNLTSQQAMSSSLTHFDIQAVEAEYDELDNAGPQSLQPMRAGQPSYFQRFSRSRCSQRVPDKNPVDSETGPLRQVCMDCKEMILQVVRAQSTARRLQFAKSLFQKQLTSRI